MMSSLLRLPSLDRSFGLSKRFSLLSNNAVSPVSEDRNFSFTSLHTLPSVELLDGNEFLNMFDASEDEASHTDRSQQNLSDSLHLSLPELSGTPSARERMELHGDTMVRSELASTSTPARRRQRPEGAAVRVDSGHVNYRSSLTSSNPSTKRSNASSRRSRKSSMSSMTEDCSSSERSSKDSDKENALHVRLKRRSQEKRVSFSGRTTQLRFRASSETNLLEACTVQKPQLQPILPTSSGADDLTVRPASRGKRLGLAMADGLTTSPPPTPKTLRQRSRQSDDSAQFDVPVSRQISRESTSSGRSGRVFAASSMQGMDRVRVGIMSHLDNIADLKACAQISKDFYGAFQRYEILLVDCVLYKQSRAAWELRHSVRHLEKPSPFRLRSVQKDYSTISALEDFAIWRCQSALRPQSVEAFLGELPKRKAELEDAIWMIWTFCNVFGKTSMSEATLAKQTQWLNAGPNRIGKITPEEKLKIRPCSMRELEDMSEMWRCLELLLAGFLGRQVEARNAGLFDNVGETKMSDRELLSAWVHDILSLGPKAVITLSSCDFEQAKVLGITRWTPPGKGKSRTNFLKAAVEEVYRDRLMKEARKKALDYRRSVQYQHKRSTSDPAIRESQPSAQPPMPPMNRHSLKVDTRRVSRPPRPVSGVPFHQERAQIRPDCDPLSSATTNQIPILSPSSNPTVFSPLAMTKNASTRLGATLFPIQNRDQSQRHSIPIAPPAHEQRGSESASGIDVIDPADRAVALLVHDMGFSEGDAKRALALSDTGSGINIESAIEILSAGRPLKAMPRQAQISELPAAVGDAKLSRKKSKREVCEGHCKPMMLVEPKRDRVTGLGMVKRGLSSRMSFRKSNRLSVIVDDEDGSPISSSISDSRSSTMRSLPSTKRSSAIADFANCTISTFTSPALQQFDQPINSSLAVERSPVSPVTPTTPDWLKPDTNPIANSQARNDINAALVIPNKPRITLQKVGTGTKKQGWSIPGRKRKEEMIQPEIIGYAF